MFLVGGCDVAETGWWCKVEVLAGGNGTGRAYRSEAIGVGCTGHTLGVAGGGRGGTTTRSRKTDAATGAGCTGKTTRGCCWTAGVTEANTTGAAGTSPLSRSASSEDDEQQQCET
jgi:hypothetical protein